MLVGVDVAHTVSAEVARGGAQLTKVIQFFGDNFVSVIVWMLAALTIWGLRRRRIEALYGTLLVGAMVGLVSGAVDGSYLWKSQLPSVGPHFLARGEVVAAFGLGFGLAAGALVALRRSTPKLETHEARNPLWLERLVEGLDDDGLAIESARDSTPRSDPLALTDLAARLAPVAGELGSDALVFVVLAQDEIGSHVWSITAGPVGSSGLRVQRGRPAPARAELHVTFPAFLSLLAGTVTIERAVATGRLDVEGDSAFVAAVEPYLGVHAAVPATP